MAETTQNNLDTILGRLVVEQGLATPEDIEQCRQLQREAESAEGGDADANERSLADVLVSEGIVTRKQIDRLKDKFEVHGGHEQIPGYRIIRKLGAGAMATVYLAKQLSLDRMVAIKVLPRKYSNNEQFVERFYAEGRAAAKLNHNNIVGALDVGKAGDYHYFVMEYVEGHTVYDDLTRHGHYSEAEALNLIIQIARALDHAHRAGFVHRDVKPKNIMITKQGVAKLADMGLARAISDREAAEQEKGKAYGTPYYISPEQIRGEIDVDARADIYGLGATCYHMVTGQVPFDGPNPSAVMHKHLKETLTPPDHLNPKLSAGVSEIIEVCMAKSREKRYNTSADLLEDLEAVAAGNPPVQARKKFDLSALAALEEASGPTATTALDATAVMESLRPPMVSQPVFWFAVAGWTLAALLLILRLF